MSQISELEIDCNLIFLRKLPTEPTNMSSNRNSSDELDDLLIENDVSVSIGQTYDRREQIRQEVNAYLSAPKTDNITQGLSDFPTIHRLYLKFNNIRSSEAICERMFSYAGMILTCKRGRLNPEFFEDLLLLHMNGRY